jgi:outer membrane protein OmpA-like peptidoglycan-associated protein
MKKFFPLIFLVILAATGNAQTRVGFIGGANRSDILESNNAATKQYYSPIYGYHGGLLAEIPLNKKHSLFLQPAVVYYNKGRKFYESFTTNPLYKDSGVKQLLNYIDIPLTLMAKIKIVKKLKFIIGAGPYASFFLSGREKTTTTDALGNVVTSSDADLPVGNGPGKYKTMDYGINVLAGFEIGHVFLRADASQSLGNMYQASSYNGNFKHQVIGVSLGVTLDIKSLPADKKKLPDTTATKPKVKEKEKIKDQDGDGVADKDDECPTVAGSAATKGCPDKDGDGVADKDDKCPDVKGSILNNGCPIEKDKNKDNNKDNNVTGDNGTPGDRDGDGINDENDQCPDVKGLLRYNGCPIPDSDGDGVNDEIDHCKDVPGLKTNHGCPLATKKVKKERPVVGDDVINSVKEKANRIQFSQSQIDLSSDATSALDEIVTLMTANPDMNLKIAGHASKEGDYWVNLGLSNSRAVAVRNYLVSKGIDVSRLATSWYGATQLLTTDPKKQALNRRVELTPY